jgi:hypothetical protein
VTQAEWARLKKSAEGGANTKNHRQKKESVAASRKHPKQSMVT